MYWRVVVSSSGRKHAAILTLLLLAAALGLSQLVTRAESGSDNPAQAVVAAMQARDAKTTSLGSNCELETQEFSDAVLEARRDPDLGPVVPRQVWTGRFVFDGDRFYEEQQCTYPESSAGKLTWRAFDGRLGRHYDAASGIGAEVAPEKMSDSAAGGSQVGAWLYLAHDVKPGEPTESNLVVKSEAVLKDPEVTLDGLRCYLLKATKQTDKGNYERRWWVAPERDWAVVKFEGITRFPWDDLIASRGLTRHVESWAEVNGVWMPTVVTHRIEVTLTDGRTVLLKGDKLTMTYQSVNTSLPLTTFQPTFPTGMLVAGRAETYVAGK